MENRGENGGRDGKIVEKCGEERREREVKYGKRKEKGKREEKRGKEGRKST